jgi:hypothetical protein
MKDAGSIAVFLLVVSAALALAEMQVQREVSTRYVCLGLIWIVVCGMAIWTAYGY